MILRHYSNKPFIFDPTRTYEPDHEHFKPRGLWLSVVGESDWKEWCESEGFNVAGLAHTTDFVLNDANVLHVDTPDVLRMFSRAYGRNFQHASLHAIDWPRVAKEYDGIIIAPYQAWCRLDRSLFWYYSWDCASGCIWNLKAISPTPVEVML